MKTPDEKTGWTKTTTEIPKDPAPMIEKMKHLP
jgi:hypothetical protein